MKAAVVTISDGVAAGERDDESGGLLVELLEAERYDVEHRVVPDERPLIAAAIRELESLRTRLSLERSSGSEVVQRFEPTASASFSGSALGVLTAVLLANSLLPAVLSLLGPKIDRGRLGMKSVNESREGQARTPIAAWGRFVSREEGAMLGNFPWGLNPGVRPVRFRLWRD